MYVPTITGDFCPINRVQGLIEKGFAFINFCENEESTTSGKTHRADPLNPIANYYDIQMAIANAHYVVVLVKLTNYFLNRIADFSKLFIVEIYSPHF